MARLLVRLAVKSPSSSLLGLVTTCGQVTHLGI